MLRDCRKMMLQARIIIAGYDARNNTHDNTNCGVGHETDQGFI